MITRLDDRHGTTRTTIAAVAKVQTTALIFDEIGIGRTTHFTRDIFHDVLAEQTFNVFGQIATTWNEIERRVVTRSSTSRATQTREKLIQTYFQNATEQNASILPNDNKREALSHTTQYLRIMRR